MISYPSYCDLCINDKSYILLVEKYKNRESEFSLTEDVTFLSDFHSYLQCWLK